MLTAKLKWVDGFQFVGESGSGHAVVTDVGKDAGGGNTGMTPMEMLLVATGGCSGMDMALVLKKKRQEVFDIEINVRGQQAEEYPRKFTDMELEYIVTGRNISEEAVKKAIELSMEKYCSVKAMLEGAAKISYSYKIVNI